MPDWRYVDDKNRLTLPPEVLEGLRLGPDRDVRVEIVRILPGRVLLTVEASWKVLQH